VWAVAGRRRVTGRFFVILGVVAAIVAFAIYMSREEPVREVVVEAGSIGQTREMDAVIMRDETVVSTESYARVDYVAEECALVSAGDTVASIYASGYSEKEMDNLESTRKEIREYYNQILENILDDELEQYTQSVAQRAGELQTIIQGKEQGNLLNVQSQLEQAMNDRQDYLRTSKREETQLSNLYQRETQLMNSIASWKRDYTAPASGIVSFYLDGYESLLTPANYDQLTIDDMRSVLRGTRPALVNDTRGSTPLFKVIDASSWSVLIVSDNDQYLPSLGQAYTLTIKGYEDYVYSATVSNLKRFDSATLIRMDIDQDVLPTIDLRRAKVSVGTQYSGMRVPSGAVYTVNGVTGVYRRNGEINDFIPVNVTASDGEYALIEPVSEGAVYPGMAVVIG
jgi:putative membrane fusion protein